MNPENLYLLHCNPITIVLLAAWIIATIIIYETIDNREKNEEIDQFTKDNDHDNS
jgi:hypothetical protein